MNIFKDIIKPFCLHLEQKKQETLNADKTINLRYITLEN